MSYKTDRLIDLLPDVYAASDPESLLYKLLDTIGAELMTADEAVKWLLKSHWVNYAEGEALDALGSIYGMTRRQQANGTLESDAAFRLQLKSVVDLFVGGGTIQAVKGAVRSALGLPFNLNQLNLPDSYSKFQAELEELVRIVEFSPTGSSIVGAVNSEVNDATELILEIAAASVQESSPEIHWQFLNGSGRQLTLERLGSTQGIRSKDTLVIPSGSTLILSSEPNGSLSALVDGQDVDDQFTNLDGSTPARLPTIPRANSQWRFRAQSALFDLGMFENETFDLPQFSVEFRWVRYQPLTFEVYVPYFLAEAVQALIQRYGFPGTADDILKFKGLPREQIQTVVNQTKAAGIRGSVQFSLNFSEIHQQTDRLQIWGMHQTQENANASDSLDLGSFNREIESHTVNEVFMLGGIFDVSTFDTNYGFQ